VAFLCPENYIAVSNTTEYPTPPPCYPTLRFKPANMNLLSVAFSGAEIGVWAALLFSSGMVLHFWWTQRQLFSSDPFLKEKK